MGVVYEAVGAFALAVGALTAAGQYARLNTRRASRLRQVATAQSGRFVRFSLVTAMLGLSLLTGWVGTGLLIVVIAWELVVQGTALVRRRARRAGSARAR